MTPEMRAFEYAVGLFSGAEEAYIADYVVRRSGGSFPVRTQSIAISWGCG